MDEKTTNDESKNVKNINVSKFIKGLPISLEDKKILLMCIAAIQRETLINTSKVMIATTMGLSEDDPEFNAFYNKDIYPMINISVQSFYDRLTPLLDEEEQNNADDVES